MEKERLTKNVRGGGKRGIRVREEDAARLLRGEIWGRRYAMGIGERDFRYS